MTKIYISADLEGMNGVTKASQCYPAPNDRAAYDQAVMQMAREVSIVAEAAFDAGAETIVVNDAHRSMSNLRSPLLPRGVELVSGKPKICAMSAGLDATFHGIFLLGYHAKAGAEKAVLCHTFHDKIYDASINGQSYGEGGINALYASLEFGVPVVLASGDHVFCVEISDLIPGIKTVETKIGLSFSAAHNHSMKDLYDAYREAVEIVIGDKTLWRNHLLDLDAPYTLDLTLMDSLCADIIMTLPEWTRKDGRTVVYQSQRFGELYQALQGAYSILSYADAID